MRISAVTRRGTGSSAEDRVLIGGRILCEEEFSGEFERPCVFGVADGVGGNAGGDIAAQFVCERLEGIALTPENAAAVNEALLAFARKTPGRERMASTFSGVFPEGRLLHVGNTRICAVQGGYLKQLTPDMTTRNYLLSLGRNEEAEECSRSEITACFGGGRASFFSPYTADIPLAGTLLLTSDGIHDHADADALESVLTRGGSDLDLCRDIADLALECGSEDDMSVIIARF